jgi:hypothetical protein
MNFSEVLLAIKRQVDTNAASTLFLNCPPGSGKTQLYKEVSRQLKREIANSVVLGPYTTENPSNLGKNIIDDLHEMVYLSGLPGEETTGDLSTSLNWINDNLKPKSPKTIVMFVDLDLEWVEYEKLQIYFSTFHYLEDDWSAENVKISIVFTGCWDHPGLSKYYRKGGWAFPYAVGHNYFLREGISLNESLQLIRGNAQKNASKRVYFKQAHELAGGNPEIMKEILERANPENPTLEDLLKASKETVQKSEFSKKLVGLIMRLHPNAKNVIQEILDKRMLPVNALSDSQERLRILGLITLKSNFGENFLTIRSWYIELLLRLFSKEIGLQEESEVLFNAIKEMIPPLTVINREAYQLLQETENLVRNYLANYLTKVENEGIPLLKARGFRSALVNGYNNNKKIDAHERANKLREKSKRNGLAEHLNPDFAYLTFGDLGLIVSEINSETRNHKWLTVEYTIDQVVSIRNAVMHNQLIEFRDLEKIIELKTQFLSAIA